MVAVERLDVEPQLLGTLLERLDRLVAHVDGGADVGREVLAAREERGPTLHEAVAPTLAVGESGGVVLDLAADLAQHERAVVGVVGGADGGPPVRLRGLALPVLPAQHVTGEGGEVVETGGDGEQVRGEVAERGGVAGHGGHRHGSGGDRDRDRAHRSPPPICSSHSWKDSWLRTSDST